MGTVRPVENGGIHWQPYRGGCPGRTRSFPGWLATATQTACTRRRLALVKRLRYSALTASDEASARSFAANWEKACMLKAKYQRFISTTLITVMFSGLCAFVLTGTGRAAEALKKVRIAFPSMVIDFAPLWVAREKGLFRDEGLDIENMLIPGGVRGVQALIAGDVQFALGN